MNTLITDLVEAAPYRSSRLYSVAARTQDRLWINWLMLRDNKDYSIMPEMYDYDHQIKPSPWIS